MLVGVGYLGQRLATSMARAFGGDPWCSRSAGKWPPGNDRIDPIGTGLGMAHELSILWEEADNNDARPVRSRNARPVNPSRFHVVVP